MISITLDEFIKRALGKNKGTKEKELRKLLLDAIKHKKNGAKCSICERPIWAVGTALCGSKMCFTCITGEADDSKDFEIDTVNYQK